MDIALQFTKCFNVVTINGGPGFIVAHCASNVIFQDIPLLQNRISKIAQLNSLSLHEGLHPTRLFVRQMDRGMLPSVLLSCCPSTLWYKSPHRKALKSPVPSSCVFQSVIVVPLPLFVILLTHLRYSFRTNRAVPLPFMWELQTWTWVGEQCVLSLRIPTNSHISIAVPPKAKQVPGQQDNDLFKCNFHLPHSVLQAFASGNCWVRFLPEKCAGCLVSWKGYWAERENSGLSLTRCFWAVTLNKLFYLWVCRCVCKAKVITYKALWETMRSVWKGFIHWKALHKCKVF